MRNLILAFVLLSLALPAAAGEAAEESAVELTDTDLAFVFGPEGPDLSAYDAILLEPASVSFRKNWQRSQNRNYPHKVTDEDMDRIRRDMAELVAEVLSEALTDGGYTLVEEAGPGVLQIKPAIVDLNLVAPDTRTPTRVMQYTEYGGDMSLSLQLHDAESGDLLARAMDHKRDRRDNYFEWTTRVTNNAMAKRMLRGWAETLRENLDAARVTEGA